ncbi:hypothetical protein HCR13_01705 [Wolbachia pipientis]|nr:hypothetical protein [Wolbachia pipientis]MBA8756865.1 hypothetical protein [Wolbachia pipientis]
MSYGKRSYIESFFSRLKQTFWFSFRNKSEKIERRNYLLNAICSISSLILVLVKFEIAS